MSRSSRALRYGSLLVCFAAAHGCGDEPRVLPPGKIALYSETARLANGLTVVAIPNRALPIA